MWLYYFKMADSDALHENHLEKEELALEEE
jgi:hypothetical protein